MFILMKIQIIEHRNLRLSLYQYLSSTDVNNNLLYFQQSFIIIKKSRQK